MLWTEAMPKGGDDARGGQELRHQIADPCTQPIPPARCSAISLRPGLPHYAAVQKRRDVRLAQAGGVQHVDGMMPQRRQLQSRPRRLLLAADRGADMVPAARIGDDHPPRPEMRVVQNLGQRLHRREGQVDARERSPPIRPESWYGSSPLGTPAPTPAPAPGGALQASIRSGRPSSVRRFTANFISCPPSATHCPSAVS